jgi:hypothetical protein
LQHECLPLFGPLPSGIGNLATAGFDMTSSSELTVGEASMFFFEKKNQKTFTHQVSLYPERLQPKQSKVFCFLFSKKKAFL